MQEYARINCNVNVYKLLSVKSWVIQRCIILAYEYNISTFYFETKSKPPKKSTLDIF